MTAFSTASVPALKNAAFAGPVSGDRSSSRSASSTYGSYGTIVKSVWAKRAELLLGRGDHLRMRVADVQAADAAGEVDEGVAVDVGEQGAARADAATIGNTTASGAATTRSLRSRIARERGPGTSVRSSIERVAAMGSR